MRTILALDLGSKLGWAMQQHGAVASGTVQFKPGRFEGGGMMWVRFTAWICSIPKPDAVYFEEVRRHAGTTAAHVYGGFLAHLTGWCEHNGVPYASIPVGTIKRHATGKGNAGKPAMIAAMRAKGYRPADDNEADALAILHCALETMEPTSERSAA